MDDGQIPWCSDIRPSGVGLPVTVRTIVVLTPGHLCFLSRGGLDRWTFQEALPTIPCHCPWIPLPQTLAMLHNSIEMSKFPSHPAHISDGGIFTHSELMSSWHRASCFKLSKLHRRIATQHHNYLLSVAWMHMSLNLYNSSSECHSFSSVVSKSYTGELFNSVWMINFIHVVGSTGL